MTEVEKVKKILEPLTFIEAYYWLRKNGVIDDVEYDSNGNITKKKTHKNNPTDMAKKIIYRAGVLWDELAKAGYCDDNLVERKQEKLLAIKTASQAAVTALTPEEKSIAVNKLSQALKTKVKK